jgi:hypothetical protein
VYTILHKTIHNHAFLSQKVQEKTDSGRMALFRSSKHEKEAAGPNRKIMMKPLRDLAIHRKEETRENPGTRDELVVNEIVQITCCIDYPTHYGLLFC